MTVYSLDKAYQAAAELILELLGNEDFEGPGAQRVNDFVDRLNHLYREKDYETLVNLYNEHRPLDDEVLVFEEYINS